MTFAKQGGDQRVVLVVDDDPDIRDTIKALLSSAGFHAHLVDSAADAILFLEEHDAPGAVLVDMVMPGIIGTSLLDYLRHDSRLAEIPVAIISASPQIAPPGYRIFKKPVDVNALLAFVRDGCDRRSATRVES